MLITRYWRQNSYTAQQIFDIIGQMMIDAGWELWDNISTTSKVYRTNGESGNRPYGYVNLLISTTYIQALPYVYWNNTTHVGIGGVTRVSTSYYGLEVVTNIDYFLSIDKDLYTHCNTSAINRQSIGWFGYITNLFEYDVRTKITQAATAGNNVQIQVESTEGFRTDLTYAVVGSTTEGRYWNLVITSIDGPTSMTLFNLPINIGINSWIGTNPIVFGTNMNGVQGSTQFYLTCPRNVNGTATVPGNKYLLLDPSLTESASDPSFNNWLLRPYVFYEYFGENDQGYIGHFGDRLGYSFSVCKIFDIFVKHSSKGVINGCVTSLNSLLSFTDNTKTWATNEFVDKIVYIASGVGEGQTRVIQSNTSTNINVYKNWDRCPTIGSVYYIVDKTYRMFGNLAKVLIKESER